ncbi:MAG: tetratricopeptide repeat protein [Polyangiaceae bacterium]
MAARACLDADLYALVPPLLNVAPKTCKNGSILEGERAEALARAGDRDLAKQAANRVIAADPKNAYAELALARLAYDQNQMNASSEHAAQALAFGRGAEADRLLGRTSLALGKLEKAEAHYQSVLQANPNDAEAAFSAAVCNDRLGHYAAAREGFLQTLRIDPKHAEARKYLVLLTYNAGAKDEARHHLEKLAELLPKDSPTITELDALLSAGSADAGAPEKH